jgi:helicase
LSLLGTRSSAGTHAPTARKSKQGSVRIPINAHDALPNKVQRRDWCTSRDLHDNTCVEVAARVATLDLSVGCCTTRSMLHGLFIGIDRYSAPVTRLSCARADAVALAALFEDSLGGKVTSLIDHDATLTAIRGALANLNAVGEDDLVVVSFSGHGTEDHRLVPVDVDATDLSGTCFGLEDLARCLDDIPSKNLLVFLDCCFSGGFGGARVFAPSSTRRLLEDRSSVEALVRGEGRVVLTASAAGEPALETMELGHGLLTHHLLLGLQGSDGLAKENRVQLLDLFNYVMRSVVDAASRLREVQTPTLYGSVEGVPAIATLSPGIRYASAFPDRVRTRVTDQWPSLAAHGFPEEALDAWARHMPGPNALQQQALNDHGVLDGRSLLVVAPTAAGKTMIGEIAAMRVVLGGSRAVMLLPLKALVNDKYEYMTRLYGSQLSVVRATGDFGDDVPAIMAGQYDLALLTYEKFLNLALAAPFILRGLSTVIVDEVQTVGDPNRGPALEFLLTLLRSGLGRGGEPQVVALSAVIGDTHGLERWLGGSLLRTEERPVPLRECVVDVSGGLRVREPDGEETYEDGYIRPQMVSGSQSSKPWIIPLVQRLVSEGKKVIVFRATKAETVGSAGYLATALGLPPADSALQRLPQGDRSASSDDLRRALAGGVGFHNADLDRFERLVLEEEFRDAASALRVLAATTTLAMGVNTPAEAVVIAGLTHPGGAPYTVAEYKNMVGRAGRLGQAAQGEAFIVATEDLGPGTAWEHYVKGRPEPIESHFLSEGTDPQTLILRSLVALGGSVQENSLVALLEDSFALWRLREDGATSAGWNRAALAHDVAALTAAELIDREPDGSLTLTELGRYAGESGIEARSITQVSSALRYAPAELCVADLVTLAQVTRELDGQHIRCHTRSRQERHRWPATLLRLGVSSSLINSLHVGGGNTTVRAKRAAACLLFMSDLALAEIERELLQHVPDRAAAGPIRQIAARTRDVVDAVAQVAIFRGKSVAADALASVDVGLRLELGLPVAALPIARVMGSRLTRAQYLLLVSRNLSDWQPISAIEREELSHLVGDEATIALLAAAEKND